MSVELAITTTFLGAAALFFRLGSDRARSDMETEDAPDFVRILYLMVGYMFVLGAIFAAGKIAVNSGYPGIKNVLDWALTAGLMVFVLLGGLLLWDFVAKVLKQVKSGGLDDSDWGW